MDRVTQLGKYFFALSMLAFGVQHIIYKGFIAGLEFLPERIPEHIFWAYLTGALLLVAGACIWTVRRGRLQHFP